MNLAHFRAFLWLRWRLFANQLTRGGIFGAIFLAIAAVSVAMLTIILLVNSFLLGYFVLPEAPPIVLLLVWDGIALLFLFSWGIGLIQELQRSEALSLEKFLHLPVSLSGVFGLNYLSSLLCLTVILWVPPMIGMSVGLTLGKGPALALQLPAAAAFVFMVTALSYQFQGWLASLMVNQRRRRTIIVMVTLGFILIFQAPYLFNVFQPWRDLEGNATDKMGVQDAELNRALEAKEITPAEFQKRHADILHQRAERSKETLRWLEQSAWLANMVLPIGWLAWGAAAAMEGNLLPGLLAILTYTLIGAASLWRAYRTTMRMYTGQFTAGAKTPSPPVAQPTPSTAPAQPTFFEKTIPWLSEQATIVALTGFRSLLRAPEVKMLLLSPIIMLVLFGGMFLRGGMNEMPVVFRPLLAFAGMAMILFTMAQLAGNQFGFDRGGFRIFVLCPAPRRDILLGKNLAAAPIVLGLTVPIVALIALMLPLRIDHLLMLPFQWVSMFLIWCMAANLLAILAPMPVAVGSLKPMSPKFVPMLLHMMFVFLLPLTLSPVLLPWGLEAGLEALDWSGGMPIGLALTMALCAAIVWLFRVVITWEGTLLQIREQKILEAVVAKAE